MKNINKINKYLKKSYFFNFHLNFSSFLSFLSSFLLLFFAWKFHTLISFLHSFKHLLLFWFLNWFGFNWWLLLLIICQICISKRPWTLFKLYFWSLVDRLFNRLWFFKPSSFSNDFWWRIYLRCQFWSLLLSLYLFSFIFFIH